MQALMESILPHVEPEAAVPPRSPMEYKIVPIREIPIGYILCDKPELVDAYWRNNIATATWYDPFKESLAVIWLNTRKRILGHQIVSTGTLDTILIHPRECFRGAIIACAAAIIVAHNHPSGDPTPSEADIKVTRDMMRAGQLLKIDLVDHIIVGDQRALRDGRQAYTSLRELGYLYNS